MNDPRLADVTKYGGVTTIAVAGYTLLEYKAGRENGSKSGSFDLIYLGGYKKLTEEQMVELFFQCIAARKIRKK